MLFLHTNVTDSLDMILQEMTNISLAYAQSVVVILIPSHTDAWLQGIIASCRGPTFCGAFLY